MRSLRRSTAFSITLVTAIVAALPAGTVLADSSNPLGNNGTVKANEDSATSTANDPHVGCDFQIDFFGLDAGTQTADVTFAVVPPTGSGTVRQDTVSVDGSGAGGSLSGLDGVAHYSLVGWLDDYAPDPNQGWHIRLTVNSTGSQGANTKFKVFWVTGCEGGTTST